MKTEKEGPVNDEGIRDRVVWNWTLQFMFSVILNVLVENLMLGLFYFYFNLVLVYSL